MKANSFLFVLVLASASLCITGCKDPDRVRANPVMMEIDGTFFTTDPDDYYRWGPGGTGSEYPDAAVRQYNDYFTFSVRDVLYDKKRNACELDMDFVGLGQPQLGVRYPLAEADSEEYGTFSIYVRYGNMTHVISEGWVEFSEFGVNDTRNRAYVSGTFSISVEGNAIRITDGKFGRMLECSYIRSVEE